MTPEQEAVLKINKIRQEAEDNWLAGMIAGFVIGLLFSALLHLIS
jgi:hypothetical protein